MKNTKIHIVLQLLALTTFLSSCAPSRIASPMEDIGHTLVTVQNTMAAISMAQISTVNERVLMEGEKASFDMSLDFGRCYLFVAMGERHVRDIDIVVETAGGVTLKDDLSESHTAIAQYCADLYSDVTVHITMNKGNGLVAFGTWESRNADGNIFIDSRSPSSGTCSSPTLLPLNHRYKGLIDNHDSVLSGSCQSKSGREWVFQLDVPEDSKLNLTLDAEFDATMYLTSACGNLKKEVFCDSKSRRSNSRTAINHTTQLDAGTWFLVVDSSDGSRGDFVVNAAASPLPTAQETCKNAKAVSPGKPELVDNTEDAFNLFHGQCDKDNKTNEHVYTMDIPTKSRVRVRGLNYYSSYMYLRAQCDAIATEVFCGKGSEVIKTIIDPGAYYLFVDAQVTHGDAFEFTIESAPVTGLKKTASSCAHPRPLALHENNEFDTFAESDSVHMGDTGKGSPDTVFAFTLDKTSAIVGRMRRNFNGYVAIQKECGDAQTMVAKAQGSNSRIEATLTPGNYFLIVDGESENDFGTGAIKFSTRDLDAPMNACQNAKTLKIGKSESGVLKKASNLFSGIDGQGAEGNDAVYKLELKRDANITISLRTTIPNAYLYVREDCTDRQSQISSHKGRSGYATEAVHLKDFYRAGTYYVFVDSDNSFEQSFEISAKLAR